MNLWSHFLDMGSENEVTHIAEEGFGILLGSSDELLNVDWRNRGDDATSRK